MNSIKEFQSKSPFDLILFTGDLVNIGGKNYKTIRKAFEDVGEEFFDKILGETGLNRERLYFVPGNHDIVRSADDPFLEAGLAAKLNTPEILSDFLHKPTGIERIKPFKEFEKDFYRGISNAANHTPFQSCFKIEIDGKKIGIACLNSSWRCYDSEKDKGTILIGEHQITQSISYLSDCQIKIALSHHHFDWLNLFDSDIVNVMLM